jgi:hypothetical protein
MKFTWEKKIVSNWSLTRVCVALVVDNSSTVPTTAVAERSQSARDCPIQVFPRGETVRTFKLAAQQDIYAAKYLDGLGDGGATLTHGAAITAYASYPVFPALPVPPAALALVDELSEFGTPFFVLYLMRREASHDVVPVRQQQPDEPDGEG